MVKAKPVVRRKGVAAKRATSRFGGVKDIYSELKKVVWPTRHQAANLTVIVIIVSVVMGILLGIIDLAFSRLMNEVLVNWP